MTLCERCDGAGCSLWFDGERLRFPICAVCGGHGTITYVYGAVPVPSIVPTALRGGRIILSEREAGQ